MAHAPMHAPIFPLNPFLHIKVNYVKFRSYSHALIVSSFSMHASEDQYQLYRIKIVLLEPMCLKHGRSLLGTKCD